MLLVVSAAVELEKGLQRRAAGRSHGGRVFVLFFFLLLVNGMLG